MVDPADRIHFPVRLTPKASRNAIQGWGIDSEGRDVLKISVTAIPEKGKANEALIALLSKEWKIAKSLIVIEKGDTDRNKIVSIPRTAEASLKKPI